MSKPFQIVDAHTNLIIGRIVIEWPEIREKLINILIEEIPTEDWAYLLSKIDTYISSVISPILRSKRILALEP